MFRRSSSRCNTRFTTRAVLQMAAAQTHFANHLCDSSSSSSSSSSNNNNNNNKCIKDQARKEEQEEASKWTGRRPTRGSG